MGTLFVDKLDPQSGTALEIGSSGDTITIPSGATITNNGTQTGFGGTNTPAFIAKYSGNGSGFAHETYTKLSFDSEVYDSGSVYDTSNYRFTPGVAGNYQLYARIIFQAGGAAPNQTRMAIYKNGSLLQYSRLTYSVGSLGDWSVEISHIDIADSDDYYEAYAYQANSGSSTTFTIGDSGLTNIFYGYKLIT
jgi:hypothetical protein